MSFAFFDLDGTLLDDAAALRAWARDFAAQHALEGPDAARTVFEHIDAVDTWAQFVPEARTRYGIETPAEELFAQIARVYPSKFVLDDAVAAGLDGLRDAGWRIAVITNGGTAGQTAKLAATGLRDHVDAVVDSESSGFRKPDRRIFEHAARALGVRLDPAGWMVGDLLATDIAGGLGAGLRTVWLSHGRPLPDGAPRPEHCAGSILEALAIVAAGAAA